MVADKIFDLSVSSQLVYQSDIPIKGKTFVKVFIDRTGEGTWEVIDGNNYQLINDSLVFTKRPTGSLLIMQVATTPSELQQTPTDISLLLTIKEEIKTLVASLGELLVVSESSDKVVIVANNITNVNTVATNISDVLTVSDSISKVVIVADNIAHVNNVDSIMSEVVNVSVNKVAVVAVSDNMASVISVKDNLGAINTVSSNIVALNSIYTNIVPNLTEILQADTNAQVATDKASEASTSASNALASELKAKKWADETTDVPVEIGKFSAKHWAEKAEDIVVGAIINDLSPFTDRTYSSSKVQSLHDLQGQAIANLAIAQGEFQGTGLPIFALTTSEQTLPFSVTVPSTDSNVFEFNDLANTCTFKINASFNFRTVLELQLSTNATRTITVTGRNLADNSVVYTRTATIAGSNGDIFQINSNQLLTVGRNGVPNSPITLYFTFKADGVGVTLRTLTSQFTSSSSYNIESDRAPLLNPKFTDSITFGVDKSNWDSIYKVVEFTNGCFLGRSTGSDYFYTGNNAYNDGLWKRKVYGKASLSLEGKGFFQNYVADTGLADSTITWLSTLYCDINGLQVVDGTVALPALTFLNDTDTGIYREGTNSLGISTAGTNRVTIDANGVTTFAKFPITPSLDPTQNYEVANKKYVDDKAGGATWVANDSRAKTALNASGPAPIYACRAWVNFNGTGTVAIRGSGNVSSISDITTGIYGVNLATAMPNANYAPVCMKGYNGSFHGIHFLNQTGQMTTTYFSLATWIFNSGGYEDDPQICIAVFG